MFDWLVLDVYVRVRAVISWKGSIGLSVCSLIFSDWNIDFWNNVLKFWKVANGKGHIHHLISNEKPFFTSCSLVTKLDIFLVMFFCFIPLDLVCVKWVNSSHRIHQNHTFGRFKVATTIQREIVHSKQQPSKWALLLGSCYPTVYQHNRLTLWFGSRG